MIAPEGLDLIIKEIWGLPSWSVATGDSALPMQGARVRSLGS